VNEEIGMRLYIKKEDKDSKIPEEEIIRQAQDGNAGAFEQLYRRYNRRVYSLCLRMAKNDNEAEDLTQDVFLLLFRKIHTFRGEARFSTWLHRLTSNLVLMRFRKKRYQEVSLDATLESGEEDSVPLREFGGPDLRLSGVIDHMNLTRAIEQLPGGYREVFILHDVEGYEHIEIAGILGCTVGNSKSQLFKARLRLRELLQEALRSRAREKRQSMHGLAVSQPRDHRFLCAKA
jgi:RNA polymerase sigma-70 factor (ECF subfamily)